MEEREEKENVLKLTLPLLYQNPVKPPTKQSQKRKNTDLGEVKTKKKIKNEEVIFVHSVEGGDEVKSIVRVKKQDKSCPTHDSNRGDDDVIFIPHNEDGENLSAANVASNNTSNNDLNNNTNKEDDLYITFYKEPPASRYPHIRANCPKHKFSVTFRFDAEPQQQNREYCDFCYCYVCDVEASKCKNWISTFAHCNAIDNVCYWRDQRERSMKTFFYKLPLSEQSRDLQLIAKQACLAVRYLNFRFTKFRNGDVVRRYCGCWCHYHYEYGIQPSQFGCRKCWTRHSTLTRQYRFNEVFYAVTNSLSDVNWYIDVKENPYTAIMILDAIAIAFLNENYGTGGLWTPTNISFVEKSIDEIEKSWIKCFKSADLSPIFIDLAARRLKQAINSCNYGSENLQRLQRMADRVVKDISIMKKVMDGTIKDGDIIVKSEIDATRILLHLKQTSPQKALLYATLVQVEQSGNNVPLLKVSNCASREVALILAQSGNLEQAAIFVEVPRKVILPRDFFTKTGQELQDLVKTLVVNCSKYDYNDCYFTCKKSTDLTPILQILIEEWKTNSCKVDQLFVHWTRLLLLWNRKYLYFNLLKWTVDMFVPKETKFARIEDIIGSSNQNPVMEWIHKLSKERGMDFEIPSLSMEGDVLMVNVIICISLVIHASSECRTYFFTRIMSAFNAKQQYLASTALLRGMLERNLCHQGVVQEFLKTTLPYLEIEAVPVSMCNKLLEIAGNSACYIHVARFCKQQSMKIKSNGDLKMMVKINNLITMVMKRVRGQKNFNGKTVMAILKEID